MLKAQLTKTQRRPVWILLATVVGLVLATHGYVKWFGDKPEQIMVRYPSPYVREFPIFGTYGRLTFWEAEDVAESAAAQVIDELNLLHRTINVFDPESELSRLNRTAGAQPFECSDVLWGIFNAARDGYEKTDGMFDVTVAPLLETWGFRDKRDVLPTDHEIKTVLKRVGLDKVQFDDEKKAVTYKVEGVSVDFGGIAKGYGLDIAKRAALKQGVQKGLIDLGGNIYCFPLPPPQREAYMIGIRNPFDHENILGTIKLKGRSVATSGNYENYRQIEGRKITHILDPRTGYPTGNVASVSIVTPRGADSDVFSTAVFVGGQELARKLYERHDSICILYVTLDRTGKPVQESFGWRWN